jgi:hypothetical protein
MSRVALNVPQLRRYGEHPKNIVPFGAAAPVPTKRTSCLAAAGHIATTPSCAVPIAAST